MRSNKKYKKKKQKLNSFNMIKHTISIILLIIIFNSDLNWNQVGLIFKSEGIYYITSN